jgi:hypothetical protein
MGALVGWLGKGSRRQSEASYPVDPVDFGGSGRPAQSNSGGPPAAVVTLLLLGLHTVLCPLCLPGDVLYCLSAQMVCCCSSWRMRCAGRSSAFHP